MAATIEEYLANITPSQRAEFERLRRIVRAAVPGVEEVISYNMPGFRYNNKNLLWIGVFKHHMSLFPGTIKFTPDDPLPEATLLDLLHQRLNEIQNG